MVGLLLPLAVFLDPLTTAMDPGAMVDMVQVSKFIQPISAQMSPTTLVWATVVALWNSPREGRGYVPYMPRQTEGGGGGAGGGTNYNSPSLRCIAEGSRILCSKHRPRLQRLKMDVSSDYLRLSCE